MAHRVSFKAPTRALGKADVVFKVRDDNGMIGTLKISRGSLVWFPRDTSKGAKISWAKFHKLMEANATAFESR